MAAPQVNLIGTFNVIRLAVYRTSQAGPEEGKSSTSRLISFPARSICSSD